ncbi:MAG: glycosyltransferase family 4 protein [Lachnospiraceae bacterium]|nr:glycosyltransferase family 4 protein [Lachnospiraceae bacterium]
MDILYLTLKKPDLTESGIYPDLINALTKAGHNVTVVLADNPVNTPHTVMITEQGVRILKVTTGELFGVNFIKKGINTLLLEPKLKSAVEENLKSEHFDMVLYATPPVTFANVVCYCKKTYGCKSFLMLKDIFPQNAVDIGLFKEGSMIHRFFRKKEKRLYELSDVIGCMSKGNMDYLKAHNPKLPDKKIILFPNTIKVHPMKDSGLEFIMRKKIRLLFGGNLGKPQAVDHLMKVIKYNKSPVYNKVEFVIAGNGSEADRVKKICEECDNATFIDYLPPAEYNELMEKCDVGIVSLDVRFTIPNYPSRMLAYMSMAKPMIACTDPNTDVRNLLTEEANCGLWCRSDDVEGFWDCIREILDDKKRKTLGMNGRKYLEENFDVSRSVELLERYGGYIREID